MKIATIGTGPIVERFISANQEVDGTEVIAVYSRAYDTGKNLASKFNIDKVYTNYEEMLNDKEIDFIYVASPNSLHYEHTKLALLANKNVICEKAFTSTIEEVKELIALAKEKELFLFEAITTLHLPNFQKIKEMLPIIGKIKTVQAVFCQYSARYTSLLNGEITNMFNPDFSGGALYDIGIYNVHFIVGLFGKPNKVKYIANIHENGIDTSGILTLEYNDFVAVGVGSKDSHGISKTQINGELGYIATGKPSMCDFIETNNGLIDYEHNLPKKANHMFYESLVFKDLFDKKDFKTCYELLNHSLIVMEVLVEARNSANISFLADNK